MAYTLAPVWINSFVITLFWGSPMSHHYYSVSFADPSFSSCPLMEDNLIDSILSSIYSFAFLNNFLNFGGFKYYPHPEDFLFNLISPNQLPELRIFNFLLEMPNGILFSISTLPGARNWGSGHKWKKAYEWFEQLQRPTASIWE